MEQVFNVNYFCASDNYFWSLGTARRRRLAPVGRWPKANFPWPA